MGIFAFLNASRLKGEIIRQRDEIARLHQILDAEANQKKEAEKQVADTTQQNQKLAEELGQLEERLKTQEMNFQKEKAALRQHSGTFNKNELRALAGTTQQKTHAVVDQWVFVGVLDLIMRGREHRFQFAPGVYERLVKCQLIPLPTASQTQKTDECVLTAAAVVSAPLSAGVAWQDESGALEWLHEAFDAETGPLYLEPGEVEDRHPTFPEPALPEPRPPYVHTQGDTPSEACPLPAPNEEPDDASGQP